MYAVNVTSPAQLPLVSGCWNSGEDSLRVQEGMIVKYLFFLVPVATFAAPA